MLRILLIAALLVTIACGQEAAAQPDAATGGMGGGLTGATDPSMPDSEEAELRQCITALAYVARLHNHGQSPGMIPAIGGPVLWPRGSFGPSPSTAVPELVSGYCSPFFDQAVLDDLKAKYGY